ncbi:MAG: DUF2442 domain-containing protein, partial [Prevotellaceae bacterium]|nr:DUF2442 domain-containing protein [Prevotellaceae bacterium]
GFAGAKVSVCRSGGYCIDKGIFRELKNVSLFNSVRPDGLSIEWDNEAALCPDTVYLDSVKF